VDDPSVLTVAIDLAAIFSASSGSIILFDLSVIGIEICIQKLEESEVILSLEVGSEIKI
jgi:hypothetical protein